MSKGRTVFASAKASSSKVASGEPGRAGFVTTPESPPSPRRSGHSPSSSPSTQTAASSGDADRSTVAPPCAYEKPRGSLATISWPLTTRRWRGTARSRRAANATSPTRGAPSVTSVSVPNLGYSRLAHAPVAGKNHGRDRGRLTGRPRAASRPSATSNANSVASAPPSEWPVTTSSQPFNASSGSASGRSGLASATTARTTSCFSRIAMESSAPLNPACTSGSPAASGTLSS
mmetsp:Transcript_28656/g.88609  ORF Transcript_28656/g.88609 Transcript_28656/m.88609 type:complete len:232 (-) Transcript_28656:420-1115(-)